MPANAAPTPNRLQTLFRALADDTRLRILGLLLGGEVCVCHIHDALGLPQPTVSRHLAYLRRAGLVATRRDGLWVHYRLADVADPVTRPLLSSALHALGHVASVRRDCARLTARNGRTFRATPVVACCADGCCAPGAPSASDEETTKR